MSSRASTRVPTTSWTTRPSTPRWTRRRRRPRRSSPRSTPAKVIRDPLGGSCPDYCSFQPICRRERGLPEDEPWSEEGEEE